jgi:hypothetical protein
MRLLFTSFFCFITIAINAQVDAIVGAVAGVIDSSIELHQLYERLELRATNFIISNRPEEPAFQVKVLQLDGKKNITDVSDESVMVYTVTFFDLETSEIKSKELLLYITSPNWVTITNMDITVNEWLWISEIKWSDLYTSFVDTSTPIDLKSDSVPVVTCLKESEYTDASNQFSISTLGKSNSTKYYEYLDYNVGIDDIIYSIEANSFDYNRRMLPQSLQHKACELPHYDINRDTYLVADYDSQISLVVNEGAFGLYMKSSQQLLQIRRKVLRKMQSFYVEVQNFDKRFELSDQDLELVSTNKTKFSIGDKGKIEVRKDIWVDFKVIKLKNENDECPVLRISYSDEENIPNEKWVRCDNDELVWF